jgi:hypothetical protein
LAKVQAAGVVDSPEAFAAFCKVESEKYAAIIKGAKIALQ